MSGKRSKYPPAKYVIAKSNCKPKLQPKNPDGILKVGDTYEWPTGLAKYMYRDIPYKDGWADASKYLPDDYDMMHLKCDDDHTIPGWCVGTKFCGMRLKQQKVLYWKRKPEDIDEPHQWQGVYAYDIKRKTAKLD